MGFAEGWILGGKGCQNNNNINNNNTKIKTLPYFSLHKASCSKHISQLTLSEGTLYMQKQQWVLLWSLCRSKAKEQMMWENIQ